MQQARLAASYEAETRAVRTLVSSFEGGIAPWSRPSRLGYGCGLPLNVATRDAYRGISLWLLECAASDRGFKSRYWGELAEWEAHGPVLAGEEPVTALKYVDDEVWHATEVSMYNGDQIEWTEYPPSLPDLVLGETLIKANNIRVKSDVIPHYVRYKGSRGGYDYIGMPPASWFEGADDYWSCLFHEMIHWAVLGTERLGWGGKTPQSELIAELGAADLMFSAGLIMPPRLDECVDNWVREGKKRPRYILSACEIASRAADGLIAGTFATPHRTSEVIRST